MQDIDYEKLADLIFDRLMARQDEYEREVQQTEHQIAELSRLQALISLYTENEKYGEAAIVLKKYNSLRDRLIKNGVIDE